MRSPGLLLCSLLLIPCDAYAQGASTSPPAPVVGPVPASVGVKRDDPLPFASLPSLLRTVAAQQDSNDLTVHLQSRLESRLERNRNDRCAPGQTTFIIVACRADFQPLFDFDFNLLSSGRIANRIALNIDYDSRREFDASNNISVAYSGRPGETIQKVEIGNISFVPPFSRFITTGVPSGNYGIQAEGALGALSFQAVAARQKGRVVRAESFTLGGRALRAVSSLIEDYAFEPRRFFFTVDPELLQGYPNIDILNGAEMLMHSAALPDTLRPRRLMLYRVLLGGQPPNPNGPQFIARGSRSEVRGLVYEPLREGIDYYSDASLLWVALVRQLRRDERLVVAYNVLLGDGTTVYPATGGTPDLEFRVEPQFANLLWDPELQPLDAAFRREVRSVYRVAGSDLVRESVDLRIVTGPGAGQEKPLAGGFSSWLELLGLSEPTNSGAFDHENRLWPRITDPNYNRATGGFATTLIPDHFVVFPSLRPFAADGLISAGNPTNEAIYEMLADDIYSSRRPQSIFRMNVAFATQDDPEAGSLSLGNVQVRPGSERLIVDGVLLVRDVDYLVDYELGRVNFSRPDTLFALRRHISVQYEENPLFAETPTSMLAFAAQLPLLNGLLGVTAVHQSQSSTFSRPMLGFERAASLLAGANANFAWDVPALRGALGTTGADGRRSVPQLKLSAEVAMSRPSPNSQNVAYLESFQGEGGLSAGISEPEWYLSSQPVASTLLPGALVSEVRASTLAWQTAPLDAAGNSITFRTAEIDPNLSFVGQFSAPEQLLWLTLYPLSIGGARNSAGAFDWNIAGTPGGTRWRSIRTLLSPSGADLSRVEHIEFWALVDTSLAGRGANPTFIIDLGDVSENSLVFSPDTLRVIGASRVFSSFGGKRIQSSGTVNSERDPFSRAFDATVNDIGLPGDVADRLVLVDAQSGAVIGDSLNARVCTAPRRFLLLGDSRGNCTVANARLDEEDLDGDGVLNFLAEGERLFRFAVNMSDPATYDRIGGCVAAADPRNPASGARCWAHFRIPISSAEQIGSPLIRRVKTLRLTVISGAGEADNAFTHIPITRIRLVGAPWQRRGDGTLAGIAGTTASDGFVSVSLIGSQDSSDVLQYQPPPGVREESANIGGEFGASQTQINERSLRIISTNMQLHDRAEAFFRFPDGQKNFMGYTQLRMWARGRNSGWGGGGTGSGEEGELNFFLRIGRDAQNFYLYRTPVNSGSTRSAWEPEIRVDFSRFFKLRSLVQEAAQQGLPVASACSATDSTLVAASGSGGTALFACDGPYMIYTADPIVSPPGLGSIQEMAVGMVRVREGGGSMPIVPGDTLELWVDEIRLVGPVAETGYAGYVGLELTGPGVADVRVSLSHRDGNFRQLVEHPTFVTQDVLNVSSTFRLDRIARTPFGWALPLTVSHSTALGDPFFISQSDIPGEALAGLRSPRDNRTSYSLTARRVAPSNGSLLQNILAGLVLNGSYSASGARTEYSDGRGSGYSFGAEYLLGRSGAAAPAQITDTTVVLAADTASRTTSRWAPTALRLSTNLSRTRDTRFSFQNPVASPADPGRRVQGLDHFWRSAGMIEFRPAPGLSARWELNSDRDLRDYGDTSAAARAAGAARSSLFGADIGMERERALRGVLNYSADATNWLSARFSLGTRFNMNRDPNTRFFAADEAPGLLPSRIANSQQASAGFTLNFGRLAGSITGDSLKAASVSRVFAPLDVNFSRGLISTHAAADFTPSLLYQLSLGTSGLFREQDGRLATSAGASNAVTVAHSVRPWRGATVTNRVAFSKSRSWNRALDDRAAAVDADARTFPDLSLRLERSAPAGSVIRAASAQGALRRTIRNVEIPPLFAGVATDRSRDISTTTPAGFNIEWGLFGGFTTAGEYNFSRRDDSRPGLRIDGSTRTVAADIRKVVRAGSIAGLAEDIRAQLSFRSSETRTDVTGNALNARSRLVDNGRYSLSFSADSDVSETMVLSLGASQVVTYDRNFNRRFTQTILSVVLHIDFTTTGFR